LKEVARGTPLNWSFILCSHYQNRSLADLSLKKIFWSLSKKIFIGANKGGGFNSLSMSQSSTPVVKRQARYVKLEMITAPEIVNS